MYRNKINEKRAKSLFDILGSEQALVDRTPKADPKWDKQPENIKDLFRESASYNTYHHRGSDQYYGWTYCGRAFKFIKG